jgi:CubicO group peptidase (beta-lactamase class C family)
MSIRYVALTLLALGSLSVSSLSRSQALPSATPESAGLSAHRLERISQILKQDVEQGKLPGAVFMLARRGSVVYSDAVGFLNKAAGKPMSRDAIFRIYSMSKPLVSVAAMMLMEDGAMQLTDPVSKFLPEMKSLQVSVARSDPEFAKITYTSVPAEREMTVQDLLRHTAGLAYGELTQNAPVKEGLLKAGLFKTDIEFDTRDLTPAEQVTRLAKVPLAHQPGAVWEYSLASDLLGRVVEAASGKRLGDFLAERLFGPLKMTDTGFRVPKEKLARVAEPLPNDPVTGKPNRLMDVALAPATDSGGAGGVSTVGDYLRFAQMLANGGQLDGVRVLSRASVALMTSDHLGSRIATTITAGELLLGTPGYTFGLGFAVRQGAGVAGVAGSAGEFTWGGYAGTYFWVDPKEGLVGVYMSQAPGASRQYYRRLFKNLAYAALND